MCIYIYIHIFTSQTSISIFRSWRLRGVTPIGPCMDAEAIVELPPLGICQQIVRLSRIDVKRWIWWISGG